ncbi:hypothetical protein JW979_03335, partial [bacterium]|nr:hypothetical protein [candidate division CSSED10-310 bacterium]
PFVKAPRSEGAHYIGGVAEGIEAGSYQTESACQVRNLKGKGMQKEKSSAQQVVSFPEWSAGTPGIL